MSDARSPADGGTLYTERRTSNRVDTASWAVLISLLLATLAGAWIHDRSGWGGFVAHEATTIMQAESLLFDRDLAYERIDHDRFAARWQQAPTDLALVSGSDGKRITFDRPAPHAVLLAPFLAAMPRNGFAVLNALLLAVAALVAARALRRTVPASPIVVAVLVFASVTFGHVFMATGDVFVLTLVVVALASVVDLPPDRPRRWAVAGALLALAAAHDPLLVVLPLAIAFAAGRDRRGLIAGFAVGAAALVAVRLLSGGGTIPGFDAFGFRFSPATGYPLVDFAADRWPAEIRQLRAVHRPVPPFAWSLDLGLVWANVRYFFAGRALGLLPYFAPMLLLPLYAGRDRLRRSILVAAGLFALLSLILRPFDLAAAGGPGALANRAFLPVFGALWLVFAKPRHGGLAVVAAAVAAPFILPLWKAPGEAPVDAAGAPRLVSEVASRWLPFETSQRHLVGRPFAEQGGVWVRPLVESVWVEEQKDRLVIAGAARGDLLLASSTRLDVVRLDFGADAPSAIEVEAGEVLERLLDPGGGIGFRVGIRPVARHPLWWTAERMRLYRLAFRLPKADSAPLAFRVTGEAWVGDTSEAP